MASDDRFVFGARRNRLNAYDMTSLIDEVSTIVGHSMLPLGSVHQILVGGEVRHSGRKPKTSPPWFDISRAKPSQEKITNGGKKAVQC
jgi:hypothetical protein